MKERGKGGGGGGGDGCRREGHNIKFVKLADKRCTLHHRAGLSLFFLEISPWFLSLSYIYEFTI